MATPFIHLHLHTEYSLADGMVRVKELVNKAVELGMPAVAVTDFANVYGMVKFYRAAVRAGIKPIIGADVWVENPDNPNSPYRLVLLCQNRAGYRHLSRLLTRAFAEGQVSGRPCIHKSWLADANDGLIMLSGALDGDIGQALLAGNTARAHHLAQEYQRLFPDRYYLELQRTGHAGQEHYIPAALELAHQLDLPVVATNHVHFIGAEDFEAHEVRVCIQEGRVLSDTRRPKHYTDQQYLRSSEEMAVLFADIPEALQNTIAIAQRCNFTLELDKYFLPEFPVPAGKDVDALVREHAAAGLAEKLQSAPPAAEFADYQARLERELDVIVEMGFAGYFLIVADFIRWAREHDIPVGPGRGSGAGSLVAFTLGITELDPIRHGLLFERFLNPERVSLPDFDIDFCMDGRDRVIEYVTERYGRARVSQIITHGTMAARAVVRDVGRVLDLPYGFVDKVAKLIPFEVGMTLEKALAQEEMLRDRYDNEEEVHELLDMARALEGLARNVGKHAGGVVIAPSDLTDFTPLYCEQGGKQMVSHLDKDDLETVGLVKFDFLGLRTLTIIDRAVKMVNNQRAREGLEPVVMDKLSTDDPAAFEMLKSCRTTALFQLESRGMKDLIKRLQPDTFEDIVALVALFRPGPLQSGMVDDFVNRKHGRARLEYPHPALEPILESTYGVILYQEQVMQIARDLAGYSLGAADLLRRAMGKKKPEEMAKQRESFLAGATVRGVNPKQANFIFDLMEKFAGYGFNKSHSAAYAVISYQTAWLKAHYPATFMAAALSADMEHTDKIVTLIAACRDLNIEILPPDVNRCEYTFVPVAADRILYGLGAIKGIGSAAIDAIVEARVRDGKFQDLFDLCGRVDLKRVNRRAFETLVKSGAVDALGPNRASLMATLPVALNLADQQGKNQDAGQNDLFGVETVVQQQGEAFAEVEDWSDDMRLDAEKETLGLFLTGHPIERYEKVLSEITDATLVDLKPTEDKTMVVAGLVVGLRTMNTKRGDRMAFVTLDDRTGRLELAVFADLYARSRELLRKDALLVVEGQVSVDEYTGGFRMSAETIYDMDGARAAFADRLVIELDERTAANGFFTALAELTSSGEGVPVQIHYRNPAAVAEVEFGTDYRLQPTEENLARLGALAGPERVRLVYARHERPAPEPAVNVPGVANIM